MDIAMNQSQLRTDFGIRNLGTVVSEAKFTTRRSDYDEEESEAFLASRDEFGATCFNNRSAVLRGEPRNPAGEVNSRSDSGDTCRSTRRRARRHWPGAP